jgi:hypothetical protein
MDCPQEITIAFRHALYLWEPRLPAMGREAAPVTDVCFESKASLPSNGFGHFRHSSPTDLLLVRFAYLGGVQDSESNSSASELGISSLHLGQG